MSGGGKKQTVGYHYRWAMHFGWCGPVDAFLEWRAGGKTAWQGRLTQSGEIEINKPDLWGGEDGEGGVSGGRPWGPFFGGQVAPALMDVMFGEADQQPNDYLAFIFGSEHQSAHRGKLTTVFKGGRFGAYVPNPKPVSAKVERILADWKDDTPWYPEKAAILVGVVSGGTFDVEIDATTTSFPGINEGVSVDSSVFPGLNATDVLRITKPEGMTYTAYSFWDSDESELPPVFGRTWTNLFKVAVPGDNTFYEAPVDATLQPTAQDAFDELAAILPVDLTGHSAYVFYIGDNNPGDNRGGLSLRIERIQAQRAMNPAHMIYDAITHPDMLGEPVGLINEASFTASADRLYSENFGLCTTYDPDNETPEQFIQRICNIIGGACTQSRTDGLYYLDLIRGDADLESLPIIDEDDVIEFEQEPSVVAETTNLMRVEWFDPVLKKERTTSPIYALGNIQATGAQNPETRVYHEIPDEQLALRVGKRDLISVSTPLSRFKITARRKHRGLRPGKAFRLQMPSEGIADMVCIVGDIAHGTHRDGRVKIVAVQDVYSMPDTVHVQPSPGVWQPPDNTPVPSAHQLVLEAPYVELAAALSSAELTNLPEDIGYLVTIATQPSNGLNYVIHSAAAGEELEERTRADWCPSAVIVEAAAYSETSFTVAGGQRLDQVAPGTWALWGEEIVRVDDLDTTENTLELGRGCADTPPIKHAAGERIYFAADWVGSDEREYVDGDVVTAKLLTRTLSSEQSADGATELQVTMDQRAARPYAPGDLRINDQSYPGEVEYTFAISWVHRDRVLQADQLIDATMSGVGPEEGVTYTVRGYLDDEIQFTVTDIGDTSLSDLSFDQNGTARIEVEAVRDGRSSFRPATAEFDYIGELATEGELPSWSINNAYSESVTVKGGKAPYVWSIETGSLPTGLTLDTDTGVVSGTPTVAGEYEFTLRVTDDNEDVIDIPHTLEIVSDPLWDDVDILLGFDETDSSISLNGNAQLDTSEKRFGAACLLLDGNGDYVSLTDTTTPNLGDGDFTLELLARFDSVSGTCALVSKTGGPPDRGWGFRWRQDLGCLQFHFVTSGAGGSATFTERNSGPWTPTTGVWYYISVVRSGEDLLFFVDSVQVGDAVSIGTAIIRNSVAALHIGEGSSNYFPGRIDEFRFTPAARDIGSSGLPTWPWPRG